MAKCPGCGGEMLYDISSQMMKCKYCSSVLSPYEFDNETYGEEGSKLDDMEVTVFTCPACGGEIYSTDNSAAGYCSFCGRQSILESRIESKHKPEIIIPFAKTKEDCKVLYKRALSKAIFAPASMKSEGTIDSFRGVYIPYWVYDIEQKGHVDLKVKKSYVSGNYTITEHSTYKGDLDASYEGMSKDASSTFPDGIADKIAPFDYRGFKPFATGFLSGFYADTDDVAADIYEDDLKEMAADSTVNALVPKDNVPDKEFVNPVDSTHTEIKDRKLAMFPVWFLSYKYNNRVAYATINGQSGETITDMPVSYGKIAVGALILTVILFIFLNSSFMILPQTLMPVASIATIISMILFTTDMKKITYETSGDLGLIYKKKGISEVIHARHEKKSKQITVAVNGVKKKTRPSAFWTFLAYFIIYYVLIMFVLPFTFEFGDGINTTLVVVSCILSIFILIGNIKSVKAVEDKGNMPVTLLSFLSLIFAAVISIINPVSDLYYYGASAVMMITIILTLIDLIMSINLLTTRRLPHFDYRGGDNRGL